MVKKPSTKSPRKQRRRIRNAANHERKSLLKCRLDEFLQEEYGLRSLVVKKGDLVKVMRGQFRDTEGKVTVVNYKKICVFLENATITKADGKEAAVPVHPSNIMLVKLELDDERKSLIQSKVMKFAESDE
ncbi:MAG: 50S ribosomal protein L24 [Candidatus Thorarchaeota archaeon]|jgi:large subunit ribosomal protein L24|nr:MAG: 50S ribosomal protein L24 [Candidatus Thorarchaeota archaeon]